MIRMNNSYIHVSFHHFTFSQRLISCLIFRLKQFFLLSAFFEIFTITSATTTADNYHPWQLLRLINITANNYYRLQLLALTVLPVGSY